MCWRRRDAIRRLDTHSFPQPWVFAMPMIFFCVPLFSAIESYGAEIYETGGHPDDHWPQASGADTTFELRPMPSSVQTSINRILASESKAQSIDVETGDGLMAEPEELDSAEDDRNENELPLDLESVKKRKTQKDNISQLNKSRYSKREAKGDLRSLQLNDDGTPFDPESATFSPDKVLVDVEKRMNEGTFNVAGSEEAVYITDEEAAKLRQNKHHPIRPLMVNPADLPVKADSGYEVIPHTLSKFPQRIDLISRKLFVRNDTDADLSGEQHRDSSNGVPIKNQKNSIYDNKTVKKDLSRSIDGKLTVPETLALHDSRSPKSRITRSISNFPSSKQTLEIITTHLERNTTDHQITDVMTVEEFKAHWWQNGTWGNRPPATSVDQTRNIFNRRIKRIRDSSDSEASAESEKYDIPHRISGAKNHLDVPGVPEVRGMVDGSEGYQRGSFHQPLPNIESIYGDSFRRKRSANDVVPVIQAANKNNVNYNTVTTNQIE